jgi:hypothetical protein
VVYAEFLSILPLSSRVWVLLLLVREMDGS